MHRDQPVFNGRISRHGSRLSQRHQKKGQDMINGAQCIFNPSGPAEPCRIVVLGATGDLAGRKLFPSLFTLFKAGHLNPESRITGCGRGEMSDDEFRRMTEEKVSPDDSEGEQWRRFRQLISYHRLDFNDDASFAALAAGLIPEEGKPAVNRLFYLALPPSSYERAATAIGRAGLGREDGGWSRIVVEKPFGHDLTSARSLNAALHACFNEEQIFSIDHYLAKETVQNILVFRFANAIFEPLWNRQYIDSVAIMATETLGVGHRAAYYDTAGVIRDMFQNHLLQLLSLIAMDPPARFEADQVQDEKVKVFRALKHISSNHDDLAIGQYGNGEIDDGKVAAYREEPGVAAESTTPTYARITAHIDNWRWRGVPFTMISGKRLEKKITRIIINFRRVPHSLFKDILADTIQRNKLIINIYPDEEICLSFQSKVQGTHLCLNQEVMRFAFATGDDQIDAYGRVLLDCLNGERLLFWRQDGLEETWKYLDQILARDNTSRPPGQTLAIYAAGSLGPNREEKLLRHLLTAGKQ